MSRTTIAVREETRARIKAGAASESKTIDAYLRMLLDEYERRRFWASFEDVTPHSYAAAVSSDGDALDEGYSAEGRALAATWCGCRWIRPKGMSSVVTARTWCCRMSVWRNAWVW